MTGHGRHYDEGTTAAALPQVFAYLDDPAWLITLFASLYAKWCIDMMLNDAGAHFAHAEPRRSS